MKHSCIWQYGGMSFPVLEDLEPRVASGLGFCSDLNVIWTWTTVILFDVMLGPLENAYWVINTPSVFLSVAFGFGAQTKLEINSKSSRFCTSSGHAPSCTALCNYSCMAHASQARTKHSPTSRPALARGSSPATCKLAPAWLHAGLTVRGRIEAF